MHWLIYGAAALLLAVQVVIGAVAALTGWLPPWLRKRTPRAKLWGYGTMLFGLSLLLMMTVSGAARGMFDGPPVLGDVAFGVFFLMMLAGGYIQSLGARERVD
ncbi:hypothetical protein [Streptomyces graminilatus]|uniref:hypothetical protein n=1 Tax=Streptomyces graminilatus TaxID=1464070 RepID=UPI0006E2FE7C|nr:hypothetical protein [Streptomyces graminilatus]